MCLREWTRKEKLASKDGFGDSVSMHFKHPELLPAWPQLEILLCPVNSIRISFMALSLTLNPHPCCLPLGAHLRALDHTRCAPIRSQSRRFTPAWQARGRLLDGSWTVPPRAAGDSTSYAKAACLPLSGLFHSHYRLWTLFPGVGNSASNESAKALVLAMFNRWYQDELRWFKDSLPESSEACCALEEGHPQEQLLFIYPAGVCHQINIATCLLARNKYLAGRRKYTGSLMTGLDGDHEISFLNVSELIFLLTRGFYPHYLLCPCPFTCPIPPTKNLPKATSPSFITLVMKVLIKKIS